MGAAADTWSDGEVRERLLAGDDRALAEVVRRHDRLVLGLARRLLGDAASAEEVRQEVFVTFWEHPQRYDPAVGGIRAYLATITRRRAIDVLRRRSVHERVAEATVTAARASWTGVAGPDEQVARADAAARVRAAVADLPDAQREAVELAYYGGLTYREVARELDLAEGTAKSRLRLGLARLSARLAPEELTGG